MPRMPKPRSDESPTESESYEVGYGKPPVHSQFKPGQSGNPKGRPNGSLSLSTMLNAALTEKIEVTKNGKRVKRSKAVIAIEQLVNKAASGDIKAFSQLAPHLMRIEEAGIKAAAKSEPNLGETDTQVMHSIIERIRTTTPQSRDAE